MVTAALVGLAWLVAGLLVALAFGVLARTGRGPDEADAAARTAQALLTAAARQASRDGLTYTATLGPDGTVTVRRLVAGVLTERRLSGVVTDLRFGDLHAALGFLDAEGARRC